MNRLRGLDPRTLIFTVAVLISLSLLGGGDLYTDTALTAVFLFLLGAASLWKCALRGILLLSIIHLAAGLASGFVSPDASRHFWLLASIFRKIFFIAWSMVFLISTITVGDCIKSLEKMKVPWVIVLPLAICIRVLPTLKYEGKIILDAMKVRGLCSTRQYLRHPVHVLELFLMTLLFRVMAISEELAFSASTRAVSSNRNAWFREKNLTINDLMFTVLVLGSVGAIVLVPWQASLPSLRFG